MIHMYTLSLKMISLFVLQLSWKLWFFHSYRKIDKRLWGHSVTSSITSSPWKYFFLHNFGRSFNIWCQIEAVFNILTFSNGRHFELATKYFTGSDTGIWIYYNDSPEHLWHFKLLIDALAQILTEILQFKVLTYFGTLWRHQWSNGRSFVKVHL